MTNFVIDALFCIEIHWLFIAVEICYHVFLIYSITSCVFEFLFCLTEEICDISKFDRFLTANWLAVAALLGSPCGL